MGKFENVPELRGTENYYDWRRQTEQLLLGEGVYNHVSQGTNPFDYIEYASTMPRPFHLSVPTAEERESIQTWLKEDGKAKSIIMRKLSPTVLSFIPDNIAITAREVWMTLATHYDRANVSLQFSIKAKIASYQMKGASDAEKYVIAHIHANDELARMGARPSDTEAIYALLHGLPKTGLWPVIRRMIEGEMERRNSTAHHPPHMPNMPMLRQEHIGLSGPLSQGELSPLNTSMPRSSNNPFVLRNAVFTETEPAQPAFVRSPVAAPFTPFLTLQPYTFHEAAQTILKEAIQMVNESAVHTIKGRGLYF